MDNGEMMPKGLLIDPVNRRIEPVEMEMATYDRYLPGGLSVGLVYEATDDVLYIDDQFLLRPAVMAFRSRTRRDGQPFLCYGLIGGPDHYSNEHPGGVTLDVQMQISDALADVEWLGLDEALDWYRRRADESYGSVSNFDGDQSVSLGTWSELLLRMTGKRK